MTSTPSSDSTASSDLEVPDSLTDEADEIETNNNDSDIVSDAVMPVCCTDPVELLQVLQGDPGFWDTCPRPIPGAIWSTFWWKGFNGVRPRVQKITVDEHFGGSPTLNFLEQIADHLPDVLLPNLSQIDISWGKVVNPRPVKLFHSGSVQTISISFEPIGERRTLALRRQVGNVLEEVAGAFMNLRSISIKFHPLGDTWESLGPSIASGRFRTIKHASFNLPMGRVICLRNLIYSIAVGFPSLVELELTDVATRVQPGGITFPSIGPLLRCRLLKVVRLHLLFGFTLAPEAWHSMALAWPELTELTVHCQGHAQFSIEPTHVGTWSSLEAIAQAQFLKLASVRIPLALSRTDPPFPRVFQRGFTNVEIESMGGIKAEHVEAGSRFLATLVTSASALRLYDESNEATNIRERVKDLVKARLAPLKDIVSDIRYFQAPNCGPNRTKVCSIRVGQFEERLPTVLAHPSPEFPYRNLGTNAELSDFRRECDEYWFARLSGQLPERKSRFQTLAWQMIIGAMAVGVDEASAVDLWLPYSAWAPDLSMRDLATVLGSFHRKEVVKIGITDNQISQRIQDAFDFALATFNKPMPIHPSNKLVISSMYAFITS